LFAFGAGFLDIVPLLRYFIEADSDHKPREGHMSDKKEKPLPKPPHTAFGRKKPEEHREEEGPLLADRLAAAMAEGKVEDFLKRELPDNEYARNLTSMMMGMTGMMPMGGETSAPQPSEKAGQTAPTETAAPAEELTEDLRAAVQSGDVKGLTDLLRREHRKRMPDAETVPAEERAAGPLPAQPVIDKDLIDALIRIAGENGVTPDWMILRAIRLYVRDYEKTGRL
jgi:hypothetical protein